MPQKLRIQIECTASCGAPQVQFSVVLEYDPETLMEFESAVRGALALVHSNLEVLGVEPLGSSAKGS